MLRTDLLPLIVTSVTLAAAQPGDLPAVLDLLASSGLPLDGLVDHAHAIVVARDGDRVVGCVALEVYPDGALLRSLAVDARCRDGGIGTRLVANLLRRASDLRVPAVYLLTTTADGYFPRFGFVETDRAAVPPGVRTSVEFQSACPASAIAMRFVTSSPSPSPQPR